MQLPESRKGEGLNANEAWARVSANIRRSRKRLSRHALIFEGECHHGEFGCRPVVVKFVQADCTKEMQILGKLRHQNVVQLIESGLPQNGKIDYRYLALEKCHDKSLGQLVKSHRDSNCPFHLKYWWNITKQITSGVEYIHGMKIIHKDLKPENILITPDEQTIKIADFGISEELQAVDETKSSISKFGTVGYRPPEAFESGKISLKSDIFSLGVIICFTLSYGGNPFGDDDTTQDHNIKNGIVVFPKLFVENSVTTEHLIRCMIRPELDDRPTIGQVLEHPCWTGREEDCNFDYRCSRKHNTPKDNIEKRPNIFKVGPDEELYKMKCKRKYSHLKSGATQAISQLEEAFPLQRSENRTTHDHKEAVAFRNLLAVRSRFVRSMVIEASEEHSPQRHIRINRLDLYAEPELEMVGTELRASWSKVDDRNATYFVDLFCNGRKESSEPYQTSECEIEFFDLKPRRKYQCKVWAGNSSGDEGNKKWSNSIRYPPASEEHSPQRHIRINRLDLDAEPKLEMVGTELRASWSKVDDRNATYFIDLFCNGRKESSEPYQTSECEKEFFDLKPRHKYQCYVWARNSSGDEGNKKWSNSIRYRPGVTGQHLSEDQPSNTPFNQTSLKSSQTSAEKEETAEALGLKFDGNGKNEVNIKDSRLTVESKNNSPNDTLTGKEKKRSELLEKVKKIMENSTYIRNPAFKFPNEEYLSSAAATWEPFLQTIPTKGGVISVGGSSMEVHPNAFTETTKVWGNLEIDHTKWPPHYTGVTAMFYVNAENELLIPAMLRLPSLRSHDDKEKEGVMAHVLHRLEGSSTWKVIKKIPLSSKKEFQFDCQEFGHVGVAVPYQPYNNFSMHIDGHIYASPQNVFTLIFHNNSVLLTDEIERDMRKSGSFEISRFSTIQLQPKDKVQAFLQVKGTEGFILDPEEPFEFDFSSDGHDAGIIKLKQISLHRIGGQNNVVKMGSFLKKDGKKIDGLHLFRYIWKDLQGNTAPQNLASVQVAQEAERSRQDLQTMMPPQQLQRGKLEAGPSFMSQEESDLTEFQGVDSTRMQYPGHQGDTSDQPTTSGLSRKRKKHQIGKKEHLMEAKRKFQKEDKMLSQSQERAKHGRSRSSNRNKQRGPTINVFSNQQYDARNIMAQNYAEDQAKLSIDQINSKNQPRSSHSREEHNAISTSDDEGLTDESDD